MGISRFAPKGPEPVGCAVDAVVSAETNSDNVAVAKLYTTNAILHGTRSNNVTLGREAITKYFTVVVNTGNKVEFREQDLKVLNDKTILVVGFNDFMRNKDGQLTPEPARFTMVLVKQGSDWLIAHHHSSLRPPPRP